jgi:hypothetical protein
VSRIYARLQRFERCACLLLINYITFLSLSLLLLLLLLPLATLVGARLVNDFFSASFSVALAARNKPTYIRNIQFISPFSLSLFTLSLDQFTCDPKRLASPSASPSIFNT